MKAMLLLVLMSSTGVRHTIEYPQKDFSTCLATKKEVSKTTKIPEGYTVKQFECILGAE